MSNDQETTTPHSLVPSTTSGCGSSTGLSTATLLVVNSSEHQTRGSLKGAAKLDPIPVAVSSSTTTTTTTTATTSARVPTTSSTHSHSSTASVSPILAAASFPASATNAPPPSSTSTSTSTSTPPITAPASVSTPASASDLRPTPSTKKQKTQKKLVQKQLQDDPAAVDAAKKIPRPPNAFILYRSDNQPKLVQSYVGQGKSSRDFSAMIGQMWKDETQSVKDYYQTMASDRMKEHRQKYPEYKYRPNSGKPKDKEDGMKGSYQSLVLPSSSTATSALASASKISLKRDLGERDDDGMDEDEEEYFDGDDVDVMGILANAAVAATTSSNDASAIFNGSALPEPTMTTSCTPIPTLNTSSTSLLSNTPPVTFATEDTTTVLPEPKRSRKQSVPSATKRSKKDRIGNNFTSSSSSTTIPTLPSTINGIPSSTGDQVSTAHILMALGQIPPTSNTPPPPPPTLSSPSISPSLSTQQNPLLTNHTTESPSDLASAPAPTTYPSTAYSSITGRLHNQSSPTSAPPAITSPSQPPPPPSLPQPPSKPAGLQALLEYQEKLGFLSEKLRELVRENEGCLKRFVVGPGSGIVGSGSISGGGGCGQGGDGEGMDVDEVVAVVGGGNGDGGGEAVVKNDGRDCCGNGEEVFVV